MKKLLNKELYLYIVFGILTTILNIGFFQLLCLFIDYKISNIITLIIVKIVAYICNKLFVFKTKTNNLLGLLKEFLKYVYARFLTLLIDYFGLILLVDIINMPKLYGKVIVVIVVVIINYILSKKYVFNSEV